MQLSTSSEPVRVNLRDGRHLLECVDGHLAVGRGFALATLNLDHVVKIATNARFRTAYAWHDMIVADGKPIVWLHRLAGSRIETAPGSDMILPLCRLAAERSAPVALVGSTGAVLERAATALTEAVPGLEIRSRIAPTQGFDPDGPEADAIFAELARTGARVVFLALGAPKQECLAVRGRRQQPEMGFVSIGAGLDFIAGHQRRAPLVIRRLGMEWTWRMLRHPLRLGPRYLRCIAILPGLMLDALRQRGRDAAPGH